MKDFWRWMRLQLLAVQIRDTIDKELGEALASAHNTNSQDDWSKVHERMNVLGHFKGADMIREQYGLDR
jgi:hypothetical protein